MFDAWTLMAVGSVSMVDARDAMLAADQIRFGGANQDLLWNVFARHGLGEVAVSTGTNDVDPLPSFESPFANEGTLVFTPLDGDGDLIPNARLFVGQYEARVTPVADTDPATLLTDEVRWCPGRTTSSSRRRGTATSGTRCGSRPNQVKEFTAGPLFPNLASSARGATASGDGINIDKLIDDTEATNWASLGSPVAGKQVTVRLDPSKPVHKIRRVQVSAMLRTRIASRSRRATRSPRAGSRRCGSSRSWPAGRRAPSTARLTRSSGRLHAARRTRSRRSHHGHVHPT